LVQRCPLGQITQAALVTFPKWPAAHDAAHALLAVVLKVPQAQRSHTSFDVLWPSLP
jgi:hypothetical protein